MPGTPRFYVRDPGGNQLEIVQSESRAVASNVVTVNRQTEVCRTEITR